ncbi:MAG: VOC family protein [Acidobacteriia bacterium]|nr:VOC family protein [Terriglobia bacterium]
MQIQLIRTMLVCLLTLTAGGAAAAAPAEVAKPSVDMAIYKHVVQVGWVVKDLDQTVSYWEKLGLKNVNRAGVLEFPDTNYRGRKAPLSLKMAFGNIGGVEIEWIQPVKGRSVYNEFLEKHGDGVHHLAFGVASPARLEEQIQHFKKLGVEVVQFGTWEGTKGKGRFAYLDTAPRGGGLTLELVYNPDAPATIRAHSENEYPFNKIVQYALVVRDVKKVSDYYQSLGFGAMPIDHNIGGWDSPESKGRFAYMDADPHGGVTIELLWNQPMPR